MKPFRRLTATALIALAAAPALADRLEYRVLTQSRYAGPVRLRNVRVFDPASGTRGVASDVVVSGNRIAGIYPAGSTASKGETEIDGAGGTLVPGLFEMHGHLGQEDALMNVLAGVTSLRDMGNDDAVLDVLIDRIGKGEVAGLRVTRSGRRLFLPPRV